MMNVTEENTQDVREQAPPPMKVQATAGNSVADGSSPAIDQRTPAIQLRQLKKNYGHTEAVKGIDLEIMEGEIFGLIGPDGAGKTSIFQILGGVMEQTSGEAIILGNP